MSDFEKLGVFYLGRAGDEPVLYDSRDLVTHAVCVGMTGSGKTGLVIDLVEEAAIDGVPALVIDPKGDLANLLLTFPALRAEDFAPWVSEEEAAREGVPVAERAAREAERWRAGLAEWGQDGARIARLKAAADFAVYTPGSTAGLPLSIVASFAAPPPALREDAEALRERVGTTATSLLGLLGIAADPLQSREHILLATLLDAAWKGGRDLDLAALIQHIQSPPVQRVGVLELESFFPAKERFALAMQLNNLLAAPGFEAWLQGDPLDVQALLWTSAGRPRVSIVSVAHLGDAERMFLVTLLLAQVVGWMRAQAGTTSLRALLVMDEVAGYVPPVANPPAKAPLLTLLKQARASGLGVVLATQNPVDLDYKGLANAGTWLVGRLQTERDRARLLDGLEGAAGGKLDRATAERLLSGLAKRQFLLHDVHEEAPVVFTTRWTLSYLCGPLTRAQLRRLADTRRGEAPAAPAAEAAPASAAARRAAVPPAAGAERPVLPPDVPQYFLPARGPAPAGAALLYRPMVLGVARVYFADAKAGVDATQTITRLVSLGAPPAVVRWEEAQSLAVTAADLAPTPADDARYAPVPSEAARARSYETWTRAFVDDLVRRARLELLRGGASGLVSRPDEPERDFRARLAQRAREERDQRLERLRTKYAPKLAALRQRLGRAEQAVAREQADARQQKVQSTISIGATILGAVLGRRTLSTSTLGRATTAARGVGRSMREAEDVARAGERRETAEKQLADLDAEFRADAAALEAGSDPALVPLEPVVVRPRKANVTVDVVALAWTPHWQAADGSVTPAFT